MTSELKSIIKKIDNSFIEYFKSDPRIKTIFVAGSMALNDYVDREDNDYDIRAISDQVTRDQIIKFEEFLDYLSKKLSTKNIEVGYSCLVGPINHKVATNKKNVLIHAMIHQKDQMDDFLPVTHKYQYGTRYRIVDGEDSLKRFRQVRYNLDELLNAHEGLLYCIDMLKKKEYRYLSWDTKDNKCEFNFHAVPMSDDTIFENCFYSTNKFINNLINYCNWNEYLIPEDKMCFAIRLLGQENSNEKTLFLLHGLFTKDEKILNFIFEDPLQETILLLEKFALKVQNLDVIFPKKEVEKSKILVKN